MLQTMRRSMIITFWAFLLFALAYIALGRITDPRQPFDAVARSYQEVNTAFSVLAYGGEIVLLVVLLGGLPVLFMAVKRALGGEAAGVVALFSLRVKWLLRLLLGALCCTVLLIGVIVGTELLFGGVLSTAGQPATPLGFLLSGLIAFGGTVLIIFVFMVLAAALSAAVMRSEFGPKLLTYVLGTMVVSALGMGVTTLATVVWIAHFWADAPQVALSDADLGRVGLSWVAVVIVVMAVATVIAVLASWRGWRAYTERVTIA